MRSFTFLFKSVPAWFFPVLLAGLCTAGQGKAADLAIDPSTPVVEVGAQLILTASGVSGTAAWGAMMGTIQATGPAVTYVAPDAPGVDVVTVIDQPSGKWVSVQVTIVPAELAQRTFSVEDSNWEVFTNRTMVHDLLLSDDGKTLWVATTGGLEQRDAFTGALLRVYMNLDGLPDNWIFCLASDGTGGLWIGTYNGLAHLRANGTIEVLTVENSGLPSPQVTALLPDGYGGLWVGTLGGDLAQFFADGQWVAYPSENLGVPLYDVVSLAEDDLGGLWIGTLGYGLVHATWDGGWELYDIENSLLPDNFVEEVVSDGFGGVYAATWGGLAHLWFDGSWDIYTSFDIPLQSDGLSSVIPDDFGGLWIGSWGGLLYYDPWTGYWEEYDPTNSGLPGANISRVIADGDYGVWIGTYGGGIAHLTWEGVWQEIATAEASIPANWVYAILPQGGDVWVGTGNGITEDGAGGAGRLAADGTWTVYTTANSGLLDEEVYALLDDGAGGVWFGTSGGLAHRFADGTWEAFDFSDAPSPPASVYWLLRDESGLWVATDGGGVFLRAGDGTGKNYYTGNSPLPHDTVFCMISDGSGGLWLGTAGGLAHFRSDASWIIYDTTSTPALPHDEVRILLSDGSGGVWVGTYGGGLAHLIPDETERSGLAANALPFPLPIRSPAPGGTVETYHVLNSDIPSDLVFSLLSDGSGGIWVGTHGGGLAHRAAEGSWELFTTQNSGLPYDDVNFLAADGGGGFWVGCDGLAHLTFSAKQALVRNMTEASDRDAMLTGNRAAVIVHPRGQGEGYQQAVSIEFMASYAYRTLQARGYDNSEIYFLSYRPDLDINGDGMVDRNVVDGPVTALDLAAGAEPRDITLGDIRDAFTWAKAKGSLDQPLVFVFTDHGLTGALRLDPFDGVLTALEFKTLLDDYQTTTGNPVVVIIEACHSGTLVAELSGPNRIVVTSTAEDLAFYDNLGMLSFSRLYFNQLRRGENFFDAWTFVTADLPTYGAPFDRQAPQLDDNGDGKANTGDGVLAATLCLNGCFGGLAGDITLQPLTTPATVSQGQIVDLSVRAGITEGGIKKVWALVLTPDAAGQRDAGGFSLIPVPTVNLAQGSGGVWQGAFSEFTYRGVYSITFLAEDQDGFIAQSTPVAVTCTDGPEPPGIHPAPIPSQRIYRDGGRLVVTLPALPQGKAQYVGLGIPGGLFAMMAATNTPAPIEGGSLPGWTGGDTVLDLPVSAPFPRGTYFLYLLRVPAGIDPLAGAEPWELGVSAFTIE